MGSDIPPYCAKSHRVWKVDINVKKVLYMIILYVDSAKSIDHLIFYITDLENK